ncbi:hypothetical protein HDV06_000205 [Boothiomyces sp. JEL0866]|nr:hypothetical protein HDV06_000205 [Boothiomyces sp. JEL0866]
MWWLILPALGGLLYTFTKQKKLVVIPNEKVVIIGASSGIGKELAKQFAARGAKVIISARRKPELEAVAIECGGDTKHYISDIGDQESIRGLKDFTVKEFQELDTLVICSGVLSVLPFEKIDDDKIQDIVNSIFNINAIGPILATKTFLPIIRKRIVIISSASATLPAPTRSLYTATKHAISGFFKSLRIELKPKGIKVFNVMPGSVKTDLRASSLDNPGQSSNQKAMLPEKCAETIIHQLDLEQEEIYIPKLYHLGTILSFIFPSLIDSMAAKKYGYK